MDFTVDRSIEAFMDTVETEITEFCGERYKHIARRKFTRWGSTQSSFVLGGKKVKFKHPRVRNVENNQETELK